MFKFYNPFARIRNLKCRLELARDEASAWQRYFRELQAHSSKTRQRLEQANRALDAHMEERSEHLQLFRQGADLIDQVSTELAGNRQAADHATRLLDEAVRQLQVSRAEADTQAQEIVEIVTWIKQAEASLSACGVAISDTEEGPRVTVDTEGMRFAVENNLVSLIMPNDQARAA